MTVTGANGRDTRAAPAHFTPRQREVLGLLAKGRTNGEIAEQLGVSLDGAKWHVREILQELGVDSREEAAEYWRRENGLPSRFRRMARSLVPGGIGLRIAIAAVAVAAVVAGVTIGLAALLGGGDAQVEPAATSTPSPAAPTATPSVSGSATASPSATQSPAASGLPDGLTAEEFRMGADFDLLATHALYWSWAGTEGPRQNLYRAYRTRSGETVIEDLYDRLPERSSIAATAFDVSTGRIAVLLCRVEYCGGYAQADPASEAYVTLSTDYGVTWSEPVRVPAGWFPAFFDDEGLIAVEYPELNYSTYRFVRFPSGGDYLPPPGSDSWPIQMDDGQFLFRPDDGSGRVFDAEGNVVYEPPTLPDTVSQSSPMWTDPGLAWTRWWAEEGMYAGKREQGAFVRVFFQPRDNGGLYGYARLGEDVFVGRLDRGPELTPVVVDLRDGVIHPIADLGEVEGYFAAHAAYEGRFAAAIPGVGDCLNIRANPSLDAGVMECVADGVLLELGEGEEVSGGVSWLPVTTPAGNSGWASAEFLR